MLSELTTYLFRYRQVYIPNVGSFAVEQRPASVDVASKLLLPPSYAVRYSEEGPIPGDQVHFLARQLEMAEAEAREQMFAWGAELDRHLSQQEFRWSGIGTLQRADGRIQFVPEPIRVKGLQSLPVKKVLREHAVHTVQVGDHVVESPAVPQESVEVEVDRKRNYPVIIAWVLLALAVAFIVWYLLQYGMPTGLEQRIEPGSAGPRYK